MRFVGKLTYSGIIGAIGLILLGQAEAQESAQVEALRRQLEAMQQNFERVVREQQTQIEQLRRQLDGLATNSGSKPKQTEPATGEAVDARVKPEGESGKTRWSPSDPIGFGGGNVFLNLSFNGLFAAGGSTAEDIEGGTQLGGHDPNQRGFTIQNLETVFEGKVDPYFRAQASLIYQIDSEGESTFEAEEAYMESLSLPLNLQVKGGQFFTEFGRLNQTHPHSWDFVDQPLVNGRFLGPDGLRSAGARLSWLAPTPFYSELFMTVANSQGETVFSYRNDHEGQPYLGRPAIDREVENLGDLLFAPRYAASFELTGSQTLVAGVSGAFGPNSSGTDTDTQIYGVDLLWKWKSPHHHGGFPFVTWQTETMFRRYEAGAYPGDFSNPGVPSETLYDYGFYSQLAYGFRKGWVAALRGEHLWPGEIGEYEAILGADADRARRYRISPNLTFYPSEFSKIRLQYNYDQRDLDGTDHSVWLQFEFLLGAHSVHKF